MVLTKNAAGRKTTNFRKSNAARKPVSSVIQDRIERAAFALIINEDNHSSKEYASLEIKLTNLLLEYKGLKAFTSGNVSEETIAQDEINANKYSGVEFTECFRYAKKRYREEWTATNGFRTAHRPFLYFFNSLYKVKANDIKTLNGNETNSYGLSIKKELLSSLLRKVKLNSSHKGYLPEINVLNIDKLLERLTLLGASKVDLSDAQKIYEGNYMQYDSGTDDDGEELDSHAFDCGGYTSFRNRDLTMMYLADLLERAKRDAVIQGEKVVVDNLDFYVTLKSQSYMFEQLNIEKVLLHDFLDFELLYFIRRSMKEAEKKAAEEAAKKATELDDGKADNETNEESSKLSSKKVIKEDSNTRLFSDFKQYKYDTARKKLRKVQLWLEDWFKHQQAA